jgi:diguanylate cyclase (GGDEF)-like protein
VLAQLVGGAIGLLADRSVPHHRTVFNVANYVTSTAFAALVFQSLAPAGGVGFGAWTLAIGAALSMSALQIAAIVAAIATDDGVPPRTQIVRMFAAGLGVTAFDASIGVLVAIVLWTEPIAAILFVPLTALIAVGLRSYVKVGHHRDQLQVLHELTATLLSGPNGDGLPVALTRIAELFSCERAEIVVERADESIVLGAESNARSSDRRGGRRRSNEPATWVGTDGHAGISLPLLIESGDARLVLRGRLPAAGPFDGEVRTLVETVAHHLSLMLRNDRLTVLVAAAQAEVVLDPLTGIGNRKMLDELHAKAIAEGQGLSVALFDLDGFKAVNDRLGHDAGDRVLLRVAEAMRMLTGIDETIIRLGGDEFVFLAWGDGHAARAVRYGERVCLEILLRLGDLPVPVSVSHGCATMGEGEALADTMRRADAAMYRAKSANRNEPTATPWSSAPLGRGLDNLSRR